MHGDVQELLRQSFSRPFRLLVCGAQVQPALLEFANPLSRRSTLAARNTLDLLLSLAESSFDAS